MAAARRLERSIDDICKAEIAKGSPTIHEWVARVLRVPVTVGLGSGRPLANLPASARIRCFERLAQRAENGLIAAAKVSGMAGKSPVRASDEQRAALAALADSGDRGEADRARAVLLTLADWTSSKIAEAFGVREDTVRLWRSNFTAGGVAALKASIAPGPPPVKSEAALRVAAPLLEEPVADRRNWTIPRLRAEIEAREGVRISRSQLSKALRKKSSAGGGPGTR